MDIIENEIKDIKDPINYLHNIITLLEDDDTLSIKLRFFFKYHYNYVSIIHFSIYQEILIEKPVSSSIIKDYYSLIAKQFTINQMILKWKKKYTNSRFWKLNIKDQIYHLINVKNKFMAIFDGSKGSIYFHLKINNLNNVVNESIHIDEMILRLEMVYKIFKYNFFIKTHTVLHSIYDFLDLKYNDKIIYLEYIFYRISKILINNIMYFQLAEANNIQFNNLLNPILPIEIKIIDVYSEIDADDINFLIMR